MRRQRRSSMFEGFSEDTFSFFMAIGFNNNREFFHDNHDWYMNAVRKPLYDLAEALNETVEEIDPLLERRPNKVVSRINRDIRFSNDKSLYRDYMFLAFRRPGEERKTTMGLYFDISPSGASYGAGFYSPNKPLMNALRTQIRLDPERAERALDIADFTMHPDTIKKMKVPEGVPQSLHEWYRLRGFYVEKSTDDFDLLMSPKIVDVVCRDFRRIAPMYSFIQELIPEEDE